MNRPVRVVHIITTLTTGGAERQLELLVERSAAQSRTLCLYEGGPVADAMRRRGHSVEVLGMQGWRKPLAIARLARRLRRLRPDVVHVHLLAAQLWGIPAARLAGVPVIVSSEHSLMADSIEGRPLSAWLRRVYTGLEAMADHTVAVSATTADRLVAWGVPRRRISVVDNGIDLDAARPKAADRDRVRAELGLRAGTTAVVVVGRLDPVKRVEEVLDALAPRLSAGGHVLLVAGAGSLRPELEARAEQLGIAHTVRWLGARDDVPALMAAADLLVSASRDETFGLAVLEAVAGGLPSVFVQCPALEELGDLPEGVARADGGGPVALRAAVDELSARGLHRRAVPPAVVARYDARRTAAAVDVLYTDHLAQRRSGAPRRG